ncbi:hypothetical protein PAXRUDRAFT_26847 [Paxillus rubicundulus Ve08.2h10]|uniref:Uncharacterized protein n=1 Tax=Paxillus rubicundulus Ve08.2h10 TaxID=930991 RepID=A0A0D0D5Q9_9AGAM|nr:hypothetical protein PAXRUDRAFT_26847 [Paxillus rubicundulus Ve08.2h10]
MQISTQRIFCLQQEQSKKKHTNAEKEADNKHLKDTKATNEQAMQKGIEHLVLMEMEAEVKANEGKTNEVKASKPQSVNPCPHSQACAMKKVENPGDGSLGQAVEEKISKPAVSPEEVDPDIVKPARGISKSLKGAIEHYKTHHPAGAKKVNSIVPNFKDRNHKKFALGSQAYNVAAEANKLDGGTKQPSPTVDMGTPPPSTFQLIHNGDIEIYANVVVNDAEKWAMVQLRQGSRKNLGPNSHVTMNWKHKLDDFEVVSDDINWCQDQCCCLAAAEKAKHEESSMCTPYVPSNPPASTLIPAENQKYNTESYVIDVVKKHASYNNKDPPVTSDQRWSHSFISTATLWCSIQLNMWSVPEVELTSALQAIFNIVYPGAKQGFEDWLHIPAGRPRFSSGRGDVLFHLPPQAQLTSATSQDFVEMPGWNMWGMASGKNGKDVITMVSAALEHTVRFITKDIIDVKQVLVDTANSLDGKVKIKLLKLLNNQTEHKHSASFQFSSANWNSDSGAYLESIQKRGQAFGCSIFTAAQNP